MQITSTIVGRSRIIGGVNHVLKNNPLLLYGGKTSSLTVGRCAEFHTGNTALLRDPSASIRDIIFSDAIRPRQGGIILQPCVHCRVMFGLDFTGRMW